MFSEIVVIGAILFLVALATGAFILIWNKDKANDADKK